MNVRWTIAVIIMALQLAAVAESDPYVNAAYRQSSLYLSAVPASWTVVAGETANYKSDNAPELIITGHLKFYPPDFCLRTDGGVAGTRRLLPLADDALWRNLEAFKKRVGERIAIKGKMTAKPSKSDRDRLSRTGETGPGLLVGWFSTDVAVFDAAQAERRQRRSLDDLKTSLSNAWEKTYEENLPAARLDALLRQTTNELLRIEAEIQRESREHDAALASNRSHNMGSAVDWHQREKMLVASAIDKAMTDEEKKKMTDPESMAERRLKFYRDLEKTLQLEQEQCAKLNELIANAKAVFVRCTAGIRRIGFPEEQDGSRKSYELMTERLHLVQEREYVLPSLFQSVPFMLTVKQLEKWDDISCRHVLKEEEANFYDSLRFSNTGSDLPTIIDVILLTKGMADGFMSPAVSEQIAIAGNLADYPTGVCAVVTMRLEHGVKKYRQGTLSAGAVKSLSEAILKQRIWELPVPDRFNSGDPYGFDTSLTLSAGMKHWSTGVSYGRGGDAKTKVVPSKDQKARFAAIIELIRTAAQAAFRRVLEQLPLEGLHRAPG